MKRDEGARQDAVRKMLDKAPCYIGGLDEILHGGLPRGRTTVISGEAGSGKSLLGLEFLYRGALAGEPGIWVGFEEPAEQVRQNAASLGWDLPRMEREGRLFLFEARLAADAVVTGDFDLKALLAALAGKAREMGGRRVVIDALEVVLRLYDEPRRVRSEMHAMNDWLREQGLTAILTVRPARREEARFYEDFFESMGDCFIFLDTRVQANVSTRRLRVTKYRGSDFGRNEYPYILTRDGFFVAPVSSVGLRHKPLGERMTSGIERLDAVLEGGYRRASCILCAGESGTGKTTLAATFVQAACGRGEKALYIGFEESQEALIGNVASAGINLAPFAETGHLEFLTSFPEATGAEEQYIRALARVDTFGPAHVVVDAISACERMDGKHAAFDYLMRLLNACKERGITVFLTNQLLGPTDSVGISGAGISSMVDTAILLSYKKEPGETNRLLCVLKSRGSSHSNQVREYEITHRGIAITDAYVGAGQALTGTARQIQEEVDRAEAERLAFEIKVKELELERLRLTERRVSIGRGERTILRGADAPGRVRQQEEHA